MANLEYKVGDIVELEKGNLAYLQHHFKDNKWGVTISKAGTPWDLIGEINSHLLGDSVIDDITKYKKVDKESYIQKNSKSEK